MRTKTASDPKQFYDVSKIIASGVNIYSRNKARPQRLALKELSVACNKFNLMSIVEEE